MDTITTTAVVLEHQSRSQRSLDCLPLECIQVILENLSADCHALYSLLLVNRSWFQMVIPFLYRSPMALIDATWPKVSRYSRVLKKELPQLSPSPSPGATGATYMAGAAHMTAGATGTPLGDSPASLEEARSRSQIRRTSTTSSTGDGNGSAGVNAGAGTSAGSFGANFGFGYAPRTHSRSSSHSSTRSWAGDAFFHGRNDAVLQKGQRERLVKRKKMQVLWVFLNCTLSDQEHEARMATDHLGSTDTVATAAEVTEAASTTETSEKKIELEERHRLIISTSTLLPLTVGSDLDIDVGYFRPMVDYLSYYTQFYHPGLRFFIWKLFPTIDDASTIEWRLISHCPERIRELYLESVQMQDVMPLVSRLETLHRIKVCHESWDVPGSIGFMRRHNELFGTVRMLELEAYLPNNHDTPMDDNLGDLVAQVEHLKVLELAGFESLQAQLELIPRQDLKVLKLNCGKLTPDLPLGTTVVEVSNTDATGPGSGSGAAGIQGSNRNERMTVSTFLSQCRQLEELLLEPVDENVLEWAVQERRNFEVGLPSPVTSSPASSAVHANEPAPSLVPLKVLELSGTDSEHVAMTISQAAEAFQDTLEVIKANSFSFNRTLNIISWRRPMPRLREFKIVGRSNLPFDFRSLQYCPALRVLDLSKYSGMRTCPEASLLNLKYLTQLVYLGLSSFDHMTDSTLRTILGCMPKLKHLRLAIGDLSASSSTLASSTLSTSATSSSVISASARGAGAGAAAVLAGISNARSSSSSGGSGSGNSSQAGEVATRSPLAAPSPVSAASPPLSSSSSSPLPPTVTTSPAPLTQDQPSPGTMYIVTGQIQNQNSLSGHHHHQQHHHSTLPTLPPAPSTAMSGIYGSGHSYLVNSSSSSNIGSLGDIASSIRSTSSLMDRFHLENNYLSLEGILDAIDGLSESKDQLEKLTIVLGKLDFEEHYRLLEQYNLMHPELEITVYRYAHTV